MSNVLPFKRKPKPVYVDWTYPYSYTPGEHIWCAIGGACLSGLVALVCWWFLA